MSPNDTTTMTLTRHQKKVLRQVLWTGTGDLRSLNRLQRLGLVYPCTQYANRWALTDAGFGPFNPLLFISFYLLCPARLIRP